MNLKTIRLLARKTQLEVANAINITQFTYSNYENGKTEPDNETLIKLADYFNTTVDNILEHETKHILDTSSMSLAKIDFINQIKNLDDKCIENLNSFLQGMLYAERERQNIINQIQKYKDE